MTVRERIMIRVDAAAAPAASPGDQVCQGQRVCEGAGDEVYPRSGSVESIRFDGDAHEFVIVLVPARAS